jgi:succinate dehydrogenase flavin-adding protein (antitoxin of CptAB toxin-antitoxin module)
MTLTELIAERQELSAATIENEGVLDEALELYWNNNEIELKSKIDGYGHVLEQLDADIVKLKMIKKQRGLAVDAAIKRTETEIEKIKTRLNYHCDGKSLRGHEYNFHPFNSMVTESINEELIEEEYGNYILPGLSWIEYNQLLEAVKDDNLKKKLSKSVRKFKISDLPENHPALNKRITPTVRIT